MNTFSTDSILTILDKPKSPQIALERSLELQQQTAAELEFRAFCWQAMISTDDLFSTAEQLKLQQQLIDERRRWQANLIAERQLDDLQSSFDVVWTPDIALWVRQDLKARPRDLVVKTVHQSRTLLHTPLDWALLQSCPAPVYLASAQQHARQGPVVAALDLRESGQQHRALNAKVMAAACRFAQMRNTSLHCVYSIEISKVLRDLDVVDTYKLKRKALANAKAQVAELVDQYQIESDHLHFPMGKVGKTIPQVARKHKASLLVVGSNAHRTLQLLKIGNSAQKIVANAKCDVLAVHPD